MTPERLAELDALVADAIRKGSTLVGIRTSEAAALLRSLSRPPSVHQRKDRSLLARIAGNVAAGLLQGAPAGEPDMSEDDVAKSLYAFAKLSVSMATAILAEVDRRAGEAE